MRRSRLELLRNPPNAPGQIGSVSIPAPRSCGTAVKWALRVDVSGDALGRTSAFCMPSENRKIMSGSKDDVEAAAAPTKEKEKLPAPRSRVFGAILGLFALYIAHDALQEQAFRTPGFKFGWFMTFARRRRLFRGDAMPQFCIAPDAARNRTGCKRRAAAGRPSGDSWPTSMRRWRLRSARRSRASSSGASLGRRPAGLY